MPSPGERGRRDWDATVGIYIVQAFGAHPLWDHWAVCVIHLRPIDGVPPAKRLFATATHELMIVALNPDAPLPELGPSPITVHTLSPVDVIEQFEVENDAGAAEILALSVKAIVEGYMSPDQDFRAKWHTAIQRTAEHFRSGLHKISRQ